MDVPLIDARSKISIFLPSSNIYDDTCEKFEEINMFRENLLSWLRENSDDRLIDRGSSKNFKKTLNFVFESIRNE